MSLYHPEHVATVATDCQEECCQHTGRPLEAVAVESDMTEENGPGGVEYLYIDEWIEALDTSYAAIAAKLRMHRGTPSKWAKEQWRLDNIKIKQLADAMGIKPEDLRRHPSQKNQPSIDALLNGQPPDKVSLVHDIVKRMLK